MTYKKFPIKKIGDITVSSSVYGTHRGGARRAGNLRHFR